MKIPETILKRVIKKLILGKDYRIEIVSLIDTEFLDVIILFFKEIINIKLENNKLDKDWYEKYLMNENLDKKEIAYNSGLNMKTITNMFNTTKKEKVIEVSQEHYHILYDTIQQLIDNEELDIVIKIKLRDVSVELDINESLIVINALAVKRSAIRGGLWSQIGKQVEKPLVETFCYLLKVPEKYFNQEELPKSIREVDFYLNNGKDFFKTEVKLMGRGNPESTDGALARKVKIFIADKLSVSNIRDLDSENIKWVELRDQESYIKFFMILNELNITNKMFDGDLEKEIDNILETKIF